MLLGAESFDCFGTADITNYWVSVGLGNIIPGAGRCGTAGWLNGAAAGSGPAIGVAATTLSGYAGFAYNPQSFNSTGIMGFGNSGSQGVCFLGAASDGRVQGWAGINTILGRIVCQTPPNVLHIGLYTHIGVEFLISTSGYMRLYINGQLVADSGVTDMTQFFNFGNNQWTGIGFTPEGYIDDLYWGDTAPDATAPWASAFFGDVRVEGQNCLTDAASGGGGTFKEFTPSAGVDHGALLDDNPLDQGATYVESGTIGLRETVKFPNITPTSGPIFGVLVLPNAIRTTFDPSTIAPVTYEGGVLSVGTNQALAQTGYRYYSQMFASNPRTAGAWSVTTVNAMEAGIKVTA